jgi:23S rRNA (guanosine2251-2'-O)-methyltransferase
MPNWNSPANLENQFRIRHCQQAECSLRYPDLDGRSETTNCPRCGGPANFSGPTFTSPERVAHGGGVRDVRALLDNIRSCYNVGSIFRTADGAGVEHLYLGGITPTAQHAKVAKTALGAERNVPWSYHSDSLSLAVSLKAQGLSLWALENSPRSESLFQVQAGPKVPVVLIVGNERAGIDPGLEAVCDRVLAVPMLGRKASLNAVVAFGIAAYFVRFGAAVVGAWADS